MDISPLHHDDDQVGDDHDHDMMCSMDMSFHWSTCEFILWRSWQANTVAKFTMTCIGFFLLAFLYEGLKYYREVLFIDAQVKRQSQEKRIDGSSRTKLSVKEQMFNMPHFYQSLLHFVQVLISYILMLIVMLCNLGLLLSIVFGAAFGYFFFGWMRKISCQDTGECCN